MGFLEGFLFESMDLGEQPNLSEGKMPLGAGDGSTHICFSVGGSCSVPGSPADLVVHLREGILAAELLP